MNIAILAPFLVIFAACLTPFQPLVNAKLNQHVDSPIWVTFISFASGTVILLVVGLILHGKFMTLETQGLKWWMFVSGAIGATYVTVALLAIPHLGAATMAVIATSTVLIISGVLDHFGILSETPHPVNLQKLIGMVLLVIAAFITMKA
jgi:transporter family-2 protein